jgi:hypothetical protein
MSNEQSVIERGRVLLAQAFKQCEISEKSGDEYSPRFGGAKLGMAFLARPFLKHPNVLNNSRHQSHLSDTHRTLRPSGVSVGGHILSSNYSGPLAAESPCSVRNGRAEKPGNLRSAAKWSWCYHGWSGVVISLDIGTDDSRDSSRKIQAPVRLSVSRSLIDNCSLDHWQENQRIATH